MQIYFAKKRPFVCNRWLYHSWFSKSEEFQFMLVFTERKSKYQHFIFIKTWFSQLLKKINRVTNPFTFFQVFQFINEKVKTCIFQVVNKKSQKHENDVHFCVIVGFLTNEFLRLGVQHFCRKNPKSQPILLHQHVVSPPWVDLIPLVLHYRIVIIWMLPGRRLVSFDTALGVTVWSSCKKANLDSI